MKQYDHNEEEEKQNKKKYIVKMVTKKQLNEKSVS